MLRAIHFRLRGLVAAVSIGVLSTSLGPPAQAAQNAEQVIFSGIGVPPVSSEAFGFWVWCQVEPASEHSHYETDCNGAMYFYDRGIVTHVTGEVTEPEEGVYVMELESAKGLFTCELRNVPPILSGPRNTVLGECVVEGEAVTDLQSDDAVVKATGP